MATYKKYKSSKGVHYDWGSLLQFAKDNPELVQLAGSVGEGQKEVGSAPNTENQIGEFANSLVNMASAINSVSDSGRLSAVEVIGLPKKYYAGGGNLGDFLNGATALLQTGAKAVNIGKGIDTEPYVKQVRNFGNEGISAGNNQDLLNNWGSRNILKHVNKYDITGGNLFGDIVGGVGDTLLDTYSGFKAGASSGNTKNGIALGLLTGGISILGKALGASNTKDNVEYLNREIDKANARQSRSFLDASERLRKNQFANALYNSAAYGGTLNSNSSLGAIEYNIIADKLGIDNAVIKTKNSTSFTPIFNSPSTYSFGDGGGIYIKPSKRGTFTAAAKKHGKSVQEFASQVLANKENYSPAMVKKANFARNASHWHDNGGMLMSDYFNNGVTMVDQGGTHENNPHEGVQMGIAPDGKPNLVEEGEAIYKDYVFSNRLRVPKEVRNKYKLRGPKDMTFAEAFREAQKESEERPNDPISEEGLENMAMVLARTQEAIRGYEKAGRKAAKGGYLFAKGSDLNNALKEAQDDMNLATLLAMADVDKELDAFNTYGTDRLIREQELENLLGAGNPELIAKAELPKGFQPITKKSSDKDTDKKETWRFNPSGLRYADIAANAAAVFGDLMGLTNNPTVYNQIPPFQAIGFNPLGNYIPVTHFDTRYAANQAAQQAAATRAAIMQSALPSRYANLLAADYNAQIANGDLLMKAALDDYDRAVKREEFNRGTNQTNSQLGLQAAMANQDARLRYAQSALQQAKMNTDETNATMGAKAANISALAESLSNVGREADAKAWRDMLIRAGVYGTLPEKPTDWSPEQWADYQKYIAKYRSSSTAAKGGKIRKKKGLTY